MCHDVCHKCEGNLTCWLTEQGARCQLGCATEVTSDCYSGIFGIESWFIRKGLNGLNPAGNAKSVQNNRTLPGKVYVQYKEKHT